MTKQELQNRLDERYQNREKDNATLLSEHTIQTLHSLCCGESESSAYRTTPLSPMGKGHKPPLPEDIAHFMKHFMNQMETSRIMFHPVEFAAIAYKRLLDICPFEGHNEETASLFLNLLLARDGYPVVKRPSSLPGYEEAMEKARIMPFPDTDPLTILIATAILEVAI